MLMFVRKKETSKHNLKPQGRQNIFLSSNNLSKQRQKYFKKQQKAQVEQHLKDISLKNGRHCCEKYYSKKWKTSVGQRLLILNHSSNQHKMLAVRGP